MEAVGDAVPAAGDGVGLVGRVLGRVDVEPDAGDGCRLAAGGEGLVGERERGVRPDHPAREREVLPPHAVEEPPVLGDARLCPLEAVAVGRLVAEDGADPEAVQGLLDDVERAVDRVRRRVVVDERGRPGEQRLHPADEGGGPDALLVERAVEPPPDPLQDLREVRRRLEGVRHPARERRVQVRVRADVAGDDETARAVAAAGRLPRRRSARPRRGRLRV